MRKILLLIIGISLTAAGFSQRRTVVVARSHYYPARRPVVVRQPAFVTYGGISYRYSNGFFYRPYGTYYRPVAPPIGIRVGFLPYGYAPIYVGPSLYYYNEGYFYRPYNNEYEVVDPPMGAEVNSLPRGAKQVTVNGEQFYEFNGTYYQQTTNQKGKTVYKVVGKNGNINNTQQQPDSTAPNSQTTPQPGDITDRLPDNCKYEKINGEGYYISPDNIYYRETKDGDKIEYQVVDKPTADKQT